MTEASQDEYRAHFATYNAFNRLVLFMVLWLILLVACMAMGLVGSAGLFSLIVGIGGTIALLIGFAVTG